MKTLADLKRDATSGKIKFELIERYEKTGDEIPERCRGIRTVKKVNSVGILLETADGKTSELEFCPAKLIEYDGKTLTIYQAGTRELNEIEKLILAKWKRVQEEYEKKNPYCSSYWKMKEYFDKNNCPCPYLAGWEKVRGKRYMNGKVVDDSIKGKAILKYNIYEV